MKKFFLGIAALAIMSCGGNEPATVDADDTTVETPATDDTTDAADENTAVLVIEGADDMTFNLKELKVKAGQTVKLTLKHVGTMGADAMGHNWILLKSGTDLQQFAMDAIQAADNDYIAEAHMGDVIAHTKVIGGGEEVTIEFEAPEAGTYDFLCSFPGHFANMQGKFIVE